MRPECLVSNVADLINQYVSQFGRNSLIVHLEDARPYDDICDSKYAAATLCIDNNQEVCALAKQIQHVKLIRENLALGNVHERDLYADCELQLSVNADCSISGTVSQTTVGISASNVLRLFDYLVKTKLQFADYAAIRGIKQLHLSYHYFDKLNFRLHVDSGNLATMKLFNDSGHLVGQIEDALLEDELSVSLWEMMKDALKAKPASKLKFDPNDTFAQIGFDSLQLASLEIKLREKFGVEIKSGTCVEHPTPSLLLQKLRGLNSEKNSITLPLPRIEPCVQIPLTRAQRRISFVEKTHGADGNDRFVEVVQIDVDGQDTHDLQQSLNAVIVRNSILRTAFEDDRQIVASPTESFFDVSNGDDCEVPSMFAGIPIRLFREDSNVVLKLHHALIDGKSLQLLALQFCDARRDLEAYCAAPVITHYAQFALLEQSLLDSGDQRMSEQYWATKLSTAEFDRLPMRNMTTGEPLVSGFWTSTIDADTNRKLSRVARLEGTTPFVQYVAIFRFVLYKLHGMRNLPVLIPVENRLQSDFESTIGLFLNLSVLTGEISRQWTISELISDTNEIIRAAVQHSIVPFEKVHQLTRQYQHTGREHEDLFQVMLVHDDLTEVPDSAAAFSSSRRHQRKVLQYPLMWYFQPHANGQLALSVEYDQQCLSSQFISHLVERFSLASAKWGQKRWRQLQICDHSLLADDEVRQFHEARIAQISERPTAVAPIGIIREQLEVLPEDKVVLKDALSEVRASELLNKYETLSCVLAQDIFRMTGESATCDAPVALVLKRDVNLVTTLLAIWNLGLTVVPISEDWPTTRIIDAVSSLGAIIITDRSDLSYPKILLLSDLLQRSAVCQVPFIDSKQRMASSDLLYITFTSGSTGRPKAVCTEACGVVNLILNYTMEFRLHNDIVVYQVVNPAFDIFFADCLMALCNGGTLLMARDRIPSIRELENVTHAYIMPSYLSRLRTAEELSVLANLQLLLYGGETIAANWPGLDAGIRMVQLFGVTEHSVYSNCKWIAGKESRLQLGRSFKNYHGFIVDNDRQPLPLLAGIEGNFCSAGIGVARGYYGCESLQNSVFTNDPWTYGWRQFHTGDRVRYGPGGALEFLGRRDNQVKISGNRVDTTEVEVRIGELPSIKQCAVMAGDLHNGGKCLLAFVTTEITFNEGACRNDLAAVLPLHMIPASFIVLPELPLNVNGKVDRHRLLSLSTGERARHATDEQSPQPNYWQFTSTVVQVFADKMRVKELLPSDDLFDKGADSLSVLMSVQELEEKHGLLVELNDVFQRRTLERLIADGKIRKAGTVATSRFSTMKKLEAQPGTTTIADISTAKTFHYPLSYNQEHIWFLQSFDPDTDAYVIQLVLELSSYIDKTLLTATLNKVIQSNAALRSRIIEVDGEPRQEALSATESNIALCSVHAAESTFASMDLSTDIPLKVKLLDQRRLAVAIHHTSVDGHSLGIIVEQITQLYFHRENPFLEYSAAPGGYFEFARNQRLSDFSESLAYWKLELSHLAKACMPTEYPRHQHAPAVAGRLSTSVRIPEDALQTFLHVHKCSLAQMAVAAYVKLLAEETSQNELLIGVPFASRTPSYYNVVGYFANSHAVRFRTDLDGTATLIRHVQQQLFDATRHSMVPFPLVVKELKPARSPLHHPIFQRMMSFENFIPQSVRHDTRMRVTTVPSKVPKFDQTWHVFERDSHSVEVSVEFDARLFSKEHIGRSVRRFHEVFGDLLEHQHANTHRTKRPVSVELELLSIWKEVLDIPDVGIDDNFFEIGGHSLLASRICAQLRSRTGLQCSTKVLFEHQTIRQMAESIQPSNGTVTMCTRAGPDIPISDRTLRSGIYPACLLQQQLLRNYLDHPTSDALNAYRNRIRIRLPRTVDMGPLGAAINQAVARQEVLRTVFTHDGSRGFSQKVLAEHALSTEEGHDTQWNPFERPVVRLSVERAGDDDILSFELDHLVSDGQSMNVLARELRSAYEGERLRDIKDSFANFSIRFNEACTRNRTATEKYWKKELAFDSNRIATDRPRPGTHKCATLKRVIEGLNILVGRLCARYGVSPASVLLYPLAKIFNQRATETGRPFAIGMVKDMRDSEFLADVIGFFTNSLPVVLREHLLATDTPDKAVNTLDKQLEALYEYSFATYEDLLQISGKDSLFDVCFVVDNASEHSSEELHGFEVINEDPAWTKFELTFFVRLIGRSVEVRIEFMEDLFINDTVESIFEHWVSALKRMEQGDPLFEPRTISGPVCDIPLVDPMRIVMEQCRLTPSAVAMQCMQGATLRYGELHTLIHITSSFILSQYFEETGELLMPDTIVPVIGHRSSEVIVLCLSVMYVGAAYLPIDEDTPRERVAAIVKKCGAKVYYSSTNLHVPGTRWLCQPKFQPKPSTDDTMVISRTQPCQPSDLAYVIYTSGSTGRPKGVAIQRKGVLNMLLSATQDLCIHDTDCVYQFTNFCFDNSVLEIFMALANGARLFIDTEPFSSDRFVQHIAKHGITHALLFPGLVETFTDEELHQMSQLRYWVTGAEKLSSQLLKNALQSGIRVVQNYGPTETTCYAMRKLLTGKDHPQNLGLPISNALVQVRTAAGEPACKMTDHELWISGVGLMRGYLNKSIDDQPFVYIDGHRYYKSGDIVRELPNGEMLFIGRKDGQVKLRGFRVETSEVEAVLHELPEVQSAKVIEDGGNLIGYYVARGKGGIDANDLTEHCRKWLPYYMIPRAFVALDSIPLTKNSKLDKSRLPKINQRQSTNCNCEETRLGRPATMDTTESQQLDLLLRNLFAEVLQLNRQEISANDDFFYLGGNSINVQKLVSKVREGGMGSVTSADVYANPTIRSLVHFIEAQKLHLMPLARSNVEAGNSVAFDPERLPLSAQQLQMWYLSHVDVDGSYVLPFVQEFSDELDPTLLHRAFLRLVQENEVLRTVVEAVNHEPYQRVLSMTEAFCTLSVAICKSETGLRSEIERLRMKKMDLRRNPPFAVRLFRLDNRCIVVLVLHHIASDATSTRLIEQEISRQYAEMKTGQRFSNKQKWHMSYACWALRQRDESNQQLRTLQIQTFINLHGPLLRRKTALNEFFPSPSTEDPGVFAKHFQCPAGIVKRFLPHARTPYVYFAHALARALLDMRQQHGASGEDEQRVVCIGSPVQNRSAETEHIVGNFLNNIVVTLPLDRLKTSELSMDCVGQAVMKALEFSEVPFGDIVTAIRRHVQDNTVALYDVYLNCRYDLENEESLTMTESVRQKRFWEPTRINHPLEVDVDQFDGSFRIEIRAQRRHVSEDDFHRFVKVFEGHCGSTNVSTSCNAYADVVKDAFCEVLQVRNANEEDDFFAHGGNSLLLLKLRSILSDRLSVDVGVLDLLKQPSLRGIRNVAGTSLAITGSTQRDDAVHTISVDHGKHPRTLYVFFAPLIGGCLSYASVISRLRNMDTDAWMLGVQHPEAFKESISPDPKLRGSLGDLCAYFDEALQSVIRDIALPTDTRIVFIGASFGGTVAYEVAVLRRDVDLVVSIDGTAREKEESQRITEAENRAQMSEIMDGYDVSHVLADARGQMIQNAWVLMCMKREHLFTFHCPDSKKQCVLLLKAAKFETDDYGWNNLPVELQTEHIPGDHLTMLSSANADAVATEIVKAVCSLSSIQGIVERPEIDTF